MGRAPFLLSVALAGCASVAEGRAPLSKEAVVLDLPLVRQQDLHACGLASIAALCQYWGVVVPPEEGAELARKADAEEGLTGAELVDALERLGMEAFLFQGTIDRSATGLYHHVDAGRPLLVMLSPDDGGGNHYSLVLGYDEPREALVLLDPLRGEIVVPLETFRRNWERCSRFTLLACVETDAAEDARVAIFCPTPEAP